MRPDEDVNQYIRRLAELTVLKDGRRRRSIFVRKLRELGYDVKVIRKLYDGRLYVKALKQDENRLVSIVIGEVDEEAVKQIEEYKQQGWREVKKTINGEKYLYLRFKGDGQRRDMVVGMLPPEEVDLEV